MVNGHCGRKAKKQSGVTSMVFSTPDAAATVFT